MAVNWESDRNFAVPNIAGIAVSSHFIVVDTWLRQHKAGGTEDTSCQTTATRGQVGYWQPPGTEHIKSTAIRFDGYVRSC